MLDTFLDFLRHQKAYSEHTVTAYGKDIYEFEDFAQQEFDIGLEEVKRDHVRSWLVFLVQERGLQPASVTRKLASIRSLYKYLLRKRQAKLDPTLGVKAPKIPTKLPTVVKQSEIIDLLSSDVFEDSWEGRRDSLILEVFYQTGMRRAELINLEWSDVFFGEGVIRVIGKRKKERRIPILDQLVEDLKDYRELWAQQFSKTPSFVFTGVRGGKMSPELVYKVVNHYLGMTHSSKNSPHVLRHSFATHMLDKGADLNSIKELLGHANLAATQVYTHNSLEKVKNVYNQAHPKSHKKSSL